MSSGIANLVVRFDAATGPFNRKIGLMRRTLRGLGTAVAGIALALAPLSAGAMFVGAAKSGEDFNRAMQRSISIMGDLKEGMRDTMEKEAIRVAKVTQFSAAEVARGYFFLASAGLSAEESIGSLATVAKFAQAGNFDLATATSLAADAQAAMGLRVGTTEQKLANLIRVTDVLTKANTLANATTEEFSRALTNKAAAAARIVGMEIEEVVATLAVFANQGVKSVDAGTAVNIVLRDLTTKAIRFRKEFKQAGIAVFDANGEFRGMANVIEDLTTKLGPLSAEQKKAALLQLGFADKSISFNQVLLGTSDAIREFERELGDAGGTVDKVSGNQLTAIQKAMELLGGRITETGKAWIDLNENAISKFLDLVGRVLPALIGTVIETVKWGAALWLLAKAFKAPIALGWALTHAMRALAVAQAFVLALSGGGLGLVKLAAVVAGAGLAVYGLKKAMDVTIDSFQEAVPTMASVNEEFERLAQKRDELMSGGEKTPELLTQIDDLTKRIDGLKKEFEKLKKAKEEALKPAPTPDPRGPFSGPVGHLSVPRRPAPPPPVELLPIEKAIEDTADATKSIFTDLENADLSPTVAATVKMQQAMGVLLGITEKLRTGRPLTLIDSDRLVEINAFAERLKDTPGMLGDMARAVDELSERLHGLGGAANDGSELARAALERLAKSGGMAISILEDDLNDFMALFDDPAEIDKFSQTLAESLITPTEEFDKFVEKLHEIRKLLPDLMSDAQFDKTVDEAFGDLDAKTGGVEQRIKDALDELDVLEGQRQGVGEFVKIAHAMRDALDAGAEPEAVALMQKVLTDLAIGKEFDKDTKLGEQIATQVETAVEKAKRQVDEINRLFDVGGLGENGVEHRRRRLMQIADELRGEEEEEKERSSSGPRFAPAAEQGTQEAFSGILADIKQRRGSTDKDMLKTSQEILKTNRDTATNIEKMANAEPNYTPLGTQG